jgi:dTDP-4-amino-4,6-dideoxygalactose transaminase
MSSMSVLMLDLKAQYATIREEVRNAVDRVLESQQFILGAEVAGLEEEIARYCGISHAIGVASGTDALLLALKALGVKPGDGVVTVAYTFFATAGAIVNLGARPLLVDINAANFNMDPDCLAAFLGDQCTYDLTARQLVHKLSGIPVKAIVPVHLYGQCAEMDPILDVARRYDLPVVEDSCQALGARYGSKRAGTIGDLGCFSFFPSKNLGGAGDGGMVVTGSSALQQRIRLLRVHGAEQKYYHSVVGFNSRLDEIQAAILRVKLSHLEEWIEARRRHALAYGRDFQAAGILSLVEPPPTFTQCDHIFHQYVVRCQRRDELRSFLRERGIGTEIYYPLPLHEQVCFRGLGYQATDFPHSRSAARQTLALPVFPELAEEQRAYVVSSIVAFYDQRC